MTTKRRRAAAVGIADGLTCRSLSRTDRQPHRCTVRPPGPAARRRAVAADLHRRAGRTARRGRRADDVPPPDAFNSGVDLVELTPGEQHTLTFRIDAVAPAAP